MFTKAPLAKVTKFICTRRGRLREFRSFIPYNDEIPCKQKQIHVIWNVKTKWNINLGLEFRVSKCQRSCPPPTCRAPRSRATMSSPSGSPPPRPAHTTSSSSHTSTSTSSWYHQFHTWHITHRHITRYWSYPLSKIFILTFSNFIWSALLVIFAYGHSFSGLKGLKYNQEISAVQIEVMFWSPN